ncbi:MAG: hypothetical protein J6H22_00395, partial [Pseudobutyrivibrio sp.]|nr:hypothetical protein [Pseudobutyrivibrio sp.]
NMKQPLPYMNLVEVLNVQDDDVVYVGGSLVEASVNKYSGRVGNRLSDLDVFILRKHERYKETSATYITDICRTDFVSCFGINCDVEVYDMDIIKEIIDGVNNIRFEEKERILNCIKMPKGYSFEKINEFLTRFFYSIPIYNIEYYNWLKNVIDINAFFKLKEYYCIQVIDNMKEDIWGNVEVGEYTTALMLCREAIYRFIEYIFSREKIFNDRRKWAWIKIENLSNDKKEYSDVYIYMKKVLYGDGTKLLEGDIRKYVKYLEDKIEEYSIEVDF